MTRRFDGVRAELNRWRIRGRLVERRADACGEYLRAESGVRVRRRAQATSLSFGDYVYLSQDVGFYLEHAGASIHIGDGTFVNRRTEVVSEIGVTIGAYCLIGWDVLVTDTDQHQIEDVPTRDSVTIGDYVWIAARATVLKGVTIGEGAIVGTGAVVNRDVPPRTLVAGVPARPVRSGVTWR